MSNVNRKNSPCKECGNTLFSDEVTTWKCTNCFTEVKRQTRTAKANTPSQLRVIEKLKTVNPNLNIEEIGPNLFVTAEEENDNAGFCVVIGSRGKMDVKGFYRLFSTYENPEVSLSAEIIAARYR